MYLCISDCKDMGVWAEIAYGKARRWENKKI